MDCKVFPLRSLKADDDAGTVTAVFATLSVVDHQGDRILPGAIGEQQVRMSAYQHGSWHGALPVGKGRVFERGNEAIFEGRFFLNTVAGREHYLTVKEMGDLQEWSFALPEMDWSMVEEDGRRVREIKRVSIPEVSPVLMGAGIDTRTLAVKGAETKGALPSHSTPIVDTAWDGPAAMRNAEGRAALRAISAWVDSDGDPDAKSSYKFPHHAKPGAPANMKACASAMGVLNGARGGADIPDADRKGVWNHIAKHMRDGDMEPPEMRAADPPKQKRLIDLIDEACRLVNKAARGAVVARALRDADGKGLSKTKKERLERLRTELRDADSMLAKLLAVPEERDASEELRRIEAAFEERKYGTQAVG